MDESKILILYCGGTLGMVRHPTQGYVPYPGFLTETLRTQNRFHDPHADSIFSWSSTTERYRAWSEAQSRPASGSNSPSHVPSSPVVTASTLHRQNVHHLDRPSTSAEPSASNHASHQSHLQPFCAPVKVLSSSTKYTSIKNCVSHRVNPDGTLELMIPTMITPLTEQNKRTRYAVLEYDPLLDSSNIETKDWLRLAADISLNYQSFDAFVILHGTDTMSYTSSALSMLLENLGKPVIVTGAQVPLSELRNDAIENVLGALIIASSANPIPEVSLFFSSTLYRGNRVSKLSNATLDAFDSPNLAPLAVAGISIEVNRQLVFKPRHISPFRAHDQMSQQVVLLRLFPGLQVDTIANFFKPPIKGVVLHSFGAGNAPTRPELLDVFRKATNENGIVIVNISQCIRGEVSAIYQVGKQLQNVGVVAGGDMTPECALTKLSYLLTKSELSLDQVRTLMGKSLRGELTERQAEGTLPFLNEDDRTKSVTPNGKLSEAQGGAQVRRLLESILVRQGNPMNSVDDDVDEMAISAERCILPFQIQQAIAQSDDGPGLKQLLERLDQLDKYAHSISDGLQASTSTAFKQPSSKSFSLALHMAAAMGHTEQVRTLLEAGYLVHSRDYGGRTPLFLAAKNRQATCVEILRSAGAHLASDEVASARFERQRALAASTPYEDQALINRLWSSAGLDNLSEETK